MTIRPTRPLQTLTDAELAGRGPALVDQYNAITSGRAARVPPGTVQQASEQGVTGIPLKVLRERHPEHQGAFWDDCEALYRGGPHLLNNPKAMDRLFPRHNAELEQIYQDRRRRAFYAPYAGKIIDILTVSLEGDPIRLVADATAGNDDDDGPGDDGKGVGEVPDWWAAWSERVTAPGASLENRHSLNGLVCEAIRAAQIKQSAWIVADLPRVDPIAAQQADSLLAQDQLGLRDPYLCLVDASEVVDWDQDADGTLLYVWRYQTSRRRVDPTAPRNATTHTWTLYTPTHWAVYELIERDGTPAAPEQVVPLKDSGPHAFGRVPWIRFWLPDGLWTMGKLESMAREHFNKRNALSWAEYKSLFAMLYEFLAPSVQPGSGAVKTAGGVADDPNRATNQIRGMGWTQRRGKDDRAEYVGPDVAPFKEARESCAELMQEMHRVTSTMAASANMDSGALKRSAESKADDRTDEEKVLDAYGFRGKILARECIELVAAGRGEAPPDVQINGLESFDVEGIAALIAEATELLNGVPQVSPTFKRWYLAKLYARVMSRGDDASPEEIAAMRAEVREAIASEEIMIGMGPEGRGGSLGGGVLPPMPEPPEPAPGAVDASGKARKVPPKRPRVPPRKEPQVMYSSKPR